MIKAPSILPASIDAERMVLGAVQIDAAAMRGLRPVLKPDHFSVEPHRRIWAAACALFDGGSAVDRLTLVEELQRRDQLQLVGGLSYLVDLDVGLRIDNVSSYADIVLDRAAKRRLAGIGDLIVRRALNGDRPDQIRESALRLLADTEPSIAESRPIRSVDEIPQIADCGGSETEYHLHPVLPKGALIAFTGDSGSGKSTLLLHFAKEVIPAGTPVLVLDRENPLSVVSERMRRLCVPDGPELRYWGGWLPQEAPAPSDSRVLDWARANAAAHPLIVIDSLVAFHGGNENDAGEMRAFLHHGRKLADLGASVVVVHHDGKADSARDFRGSSDFKAGIDAGFHVSNSSDDGRLGTLRLRCFKSRFGFSGDLIFYYTGSGFRRDQSADAPSRTASEQLACLLRLNPGVKPAELETLATRAGVRRARIRQWMNDGLLLGSIRVESGSHNSKRLFLVGGDEMGLSTDES